jgi:hypothetical protein
MAKKPPQPPKPPEDDFDPDLIEDIVPLDEADEAVEGATTVGHGAADEVLPEVEVEADEVLEVEPDDLFGEVAEDDGATKMMQGSKGEALPEVEIGADEIVEEVAADDLFADVETDTSEGATHLGSGDKGQPLPEVEIAADEVLAEDALLEPAAVLEEEVSPHEAETLAEMPVLDDADALADLGEEPVLEAADEGELVAAGVGGGDDIEEAKYEEEVPKPQLTGLTWTLIALNFIAILVAPYLLLLDYHKRNQYAYAVFLVNLRALGLPNEEEEKALTAARVTLPGYRISPDEIKRIVKDRGFTFADKFEGFEETFLERVRPSALDKDILKDHLGGGELVPTVEAEVRRIQNLVVADIEKAAQEAFAAEKSDADRRKRIVDMLHPLAMDTYQAEKLDKRIKAAQGADVQKLYMEAAQRRMAFDFLLPLELFRPGEVKGMFVEKIGDLDALPLDKVLERVTERIKSTIDKNYQPALHLGEEWGSLQRDTIEKRLTVAFTLLSLAHVKKPDGELLYPQLLDRMERVMGQYDMALACELFPSRVLSINERVLERIKIDREGFMAPDKAGALVRGKAFIDFYEDELQRIRFAQHDIVLAKLRLKELQDHKTRYETLLKERIEQRDDVLARIAKAREKTAKDAAELRVYQDELFRFQTELATSEDELLRIHQELREKQKAADSGGR